MFKNIIYVIGTFLILTGFMTVDAPEQTPEEILIKVAKEYEKHQGISYEIDYDMKFFSGADTNHIQAECHLYREPADSLFAGYLWFKSADGYDRIYDLDKAYMRNPREKKLEQFDAHNNEAFVITGNIMGDIRNVYFLKPEKLVRNAENKSLVKKLSTESFNDQTYWRIDFISPDTEEYSEIVKTIWVNQKKWLIEKITYSIKFQGEYQYNEWNLKNIRFDEIKPEDFSNQIAQLKEEFPLEVYKQPDESYYAPLANGSPSQDFQGLHYQNGDSLALADFEGKVVIMDFWYMDCFPCIKAIPHLNEIFNTYKDEEVIVLGVDSKDLDERDKTRMKTFLEHNTIDYPIVLTTYKTDSTYNVRAYPTLYAIGKEGKVIYSQVGYNEALKDTLDSVIRRELDLD